MRLLRWLTSSTVLAATILAVLVAACSAAVSPEPDRQTTTKVFYYHDDTHNVSCWVSNWGQTCLPDWQLNAPVTQIGS